MGAGDGTFEVRPGGSAPRPPYPWGSDPNQPPCIGFGAGPFRPSAYGSTGGSIALADYDLDRDLDVALSMSGGPAAVVFLNAGDGSFPLSSRAYLTGDAAHGIAAADFHRGRAVDLAVCSGAEGLVLRNLGVPDTDGVGDLCDHCPFGGDPPADTNNNGVSDCIDPEIVDITISFSSQYGRGSGTLSWRTLSEVDLLGFDIIERDPDGRVRRLNDVPIPCEECPWGIGNTYTYILPKHRSGRNLYVVRIGPASRLEYGPAQRR